MYSAAQVPLLAFLAITVYFVGLEWETGSWMADVAVIERGEMTEGLI